MNDGRKNPGCTLTMAKEFLCKLKEMLACSMLGDIVLDTLHFPFLVLSAAFNIAQTLATVIIKDENMD